MEPFVIQEEYHLTLTSAIFLLPEFIKEQCAHKVSNRSTWSARVDYEYIHGLQSTVRIFISTVYSSVQMKNLQGHTVKILKHSLFSTFSGSGFQECNVALSPLRSLPCSQQQCHAVCESSSRQVLLLALPLQTSSVISCHTLPR